MAGKVPNEDGYDAIFIDELPEFLQCIVCHLALKKPLQVISCGHKFCTTCFEKMKIFSASRGSELCCPWDRQVIDTSMVFPDTSVERLVLNLKVKCDNSAKSCEWIGDLRSLQTHMKTACLYEVASCKYLGCSVVIERCKLKEHMDTCNKKVDEGVIMLFNQLTMKMQCVEEKYEGLFQKQNAELESFKETIACQNSTIKKLEEKVNSQEMTLVELKATVKQQNDQLKKLDHSIAPLQEKLTHILDHQLIDEAKAVTEIEKRKTATQISHLEFNEHQRIMKNCQDAMKKHDEDLSAFKSMLNVLTVEKPVFTWKLTDYSNIDKDCTLYSPFFYTGMKGYRMQLQAEWGGERNGRLGVFLGIFATQYFNELKWPFKKKGIFRCLDVFGKEHIKSIDDWDGVIGDDVRGKTGSVEGIPVFLNMPILQKCVIDECLTIDCWFV